MPNSRRVVVMLSLLALAAAGCSGGGHTKAGGKAVKTITLTMETPDAPDAPNADFFIREVATRTHGRVRIIEGTSYPSSNPDNEARLAVALRLGKAQMAYIPSRAWERDGGRVLAFRALQAPFLVTSYKLLRRIAAGPLGRELLATLKRNGLVGLGLVPEELRRPLGRRPLVSPADFRGARIRVVTSPTSVLILRTLRALPFTHLSSAQVGPALASGRLDGVESAVNAIDTNGYTQEAKYLTANLVLFAKTQTIVIRRQVFEQLNPSDRRALSQAADTVVAQADPASGERHELRRLCAAGLRLLDATSADLAALRRAAGPAYATLERDALTKKMINQIGQLKLQVSGASVSLPACAHPDRNAVGSASSRFPLGTFETIITRADETRAGSPPNDAHYETLTFRKDGTWLDVVFHPRTAANPPGGGHYTVRGDVLTLPPTPDVLKWSYFRGLLTFQIISVPDAGARLAYTAHSWRKIR